MSMPLSAEFSSSVSRMKRLTAAEELGERQAEVFVDARERLVELRPRDLVDLLDGRLRVLDGVEQVLALRLQELVPLGDLGVLLERHHVHRAHRFQAILQLAAGIFFADQRVAFQPRNIFLHAKLGRLYAEIVDAGCLNVLKIGGELGRGCTACRTRFAQASVSARSPFSWCFGFGQCGA